MELTGKTVNFLGDSITEGCGVARPDQDTYWALLRERLSLACARNYGLGGSRFANQEPLDIPSFCQRFPAMEAADIVVVFGGCNDYFHGTAKLGTFADTTPDTFYGACHTLMRGLIEKYPDSPIVFMSPLHNIHGGANAANGYTMEQYVAIIREMTEYYSLPLLDLYRCSGIQPQVEISRQRLCPDGVHPNEAGHRLLASRLEGFLRSL